MKSGHVYRRDLGDGRMSKWHAVVDLPRGLDGKRRQKTKSFATEDDPSSAQHWWYMAPPKPDVDSLRFSRANVDRFFARINYDESGCWLWTGPLISGYGQFYVAGAQIKVPAHRWSYEYWVDPIPPGMTIDHICHQPQDCRGGLTCPHRACQNPDHMKIETPLENAARRSPNRGWAPEKKWTHCIRGHEFTEETTRTYTRRNGTTARTCWICHKIRAEKTP
jgi:hypothetical protein